jgi:hypothetical protein
VYAFVQSTTLAARTAPRSVVAVPSTTRVTRVSSWIRAPARAAAAARPRTHFAGCSSPSSAYVAQRALTSVVTATP